MTLLCENTVRGRGLTGEHGLSWWVETPNARLLFDTGQGISLLHNAARLGIPLEKANAVILSHGHYDHAGGLADLLAMRTDIPIFCHPDAFLQRFNKEAGQCREVNLPFLYEGQLVNSGADLRLIREPTCIVDQIYATGEIPRVTDFEDTGGAFFLDTDGHNADSITDDQAIYFESKEGLVVILGCAHAGVVNTLEHVMKLTRKTKVHAVMGGMHLVNADEARIRRTKEYFAQVGVQKLMPCHCTGIRAVSKLFSSLPDACMEGHVGKTVVFPL